MTLVLAAIINGVLALGVIAAIVGMHAWAILTSSQAHDAPTSGSLHTAAYTSGAEAGQDAYTARGIALG
jgi:hypothetical protein